MIDTDNLRTASLYINNQLLSRGLLRDGQSIDFANPGDDYDEIAVVMSRIISVVNDLILRRDRDAEQRESLSTTMRALRADNLKHVNDMSRLLEKHSESQRKLDIAEASEAALKTQLKSAEAAARGLKDEVARTKALVAQARTSCATEVRRRDRQIDTLKKQLGEAGRARGSRGNPAITTITVSGEVGEDKASPTKTTAATAQEYSLRSETNAFLVELAHNLSVENESLMRIMLRTLTRLREMSGLGPESNADDHVVKQLTSDDMASELDSVLKHMRTILTNPSFVPIEEVMVREEEINRLKDGWVKMEDRWKEAVHLIDGWRRRMASSGRPVCEEELKMGLRLSPVRVKDVEETRHAMDTRLDVVTEEEEDDVRAMQQSPCPPRGGAYSPGPEQYQQDAAHEQSDDDSSMMDEDLDVDDYDVSEPNVEILQQSTAVRYPYFESSRDSSPPLPEPPHLSPLRNSPSAGNRGQVNNTRARQKPGDFTTIVEEKTWELTSEPVPPPPPPHRSPSPRRLQPSSTAPKPAERSRSRSPTRTSLDDALLGKRQRDESEMMIDSPSPSRGPSRQVSGTRKQEASAAGEQTPRQAASRLPLPANAEQAPQQSPLTMATIAAKLAAAEREADAARVRAKLKAVRGTRGVKKPTLTPARTPVKREPRKPVLDTAKAEAPVQNVDPVKQDPSSQAAQPAKRKRATKAASRRRSTLSPWELESLMSGKVQ